MYNDKDLIQKYIDRREKNFLQKKRKFICLLDLYQFTDTPPKKMLMLYPNSKGNLYQKPYHRISRLMEYLALGSVVSAVDYDEDTDKKYWSEELSLYIESRSNIWWDEIDLTLDDSNRFPVDLDPPVDNRFYAYRLTPRFNSFLRDMTKKVEELGGRVELDEHNKKHVTEKGILLDGKIIYQEDIDEGRVKLPEK